MKEIIRENQKRIKAIIKNITGRENEDIEQEVYIKVWRGSNKKGSVSSLSQWVNRITANACKDFLKSKQHRIEQMKMEDDTVINEIKETKTPETKKISSTTNVVKAPAVETKVENVPVTKEVIILYEFEQKTYEEISQKVGAPIGTVKSRLFCAREILKDDLSELIGD